MLTICRSPKHYRIGIVPLKQIETMSVATEYDDMSLEMLQEMVPMLRQQLEKSMLDRNYVQLENVRKTFYREYQGLHDNLSLYIFCNIGLDRRLFQNYKSGGQGIGTCRSS